MALLLTLVAAPVSARESMAVGISQGGSNGGRNLATLANFTASVGGNQPATWSVWSQWGSRGGKWKCYRDAPALGTCRFPRSTLDALPAGVVPVIWWEPWDPTKPHLGRFPRYKNINAGKHNEYIKQWAKDAADYGGRVVLRFAHEANGDFFPWGIRSFDNNATNFKKAWRKVYKIFQQEGATNVEFLWSVTKSSCPGGCNPFKKVYPGYKFIEWAGITAFNWGPKKTWKSMKATLKRPVGQMLKVTGKKIIISELASHWKGGNKADWIKFGYRKVYNTWPRIKAIIYLNTDQRPSGHPDWRLTKPNNGSALASYKNNVASDPRFQGSLPNP